MPTSMHAQAQEKVCLYVHVYMWHQTSLKEHVLITHNALFTFFISFFLNADLYKVDCITYQWVTTFYFKTLI